MGRRLQNDRDRKKGRSNGDIGEVKVEEMKRWKEQLGKGRRSYVNLANYLASSPWSTQWKGTLNCRCILSRSASIAAALINALCSASNAESRSSLCLLHIFCNACTQPVNCLFMIHEAQLSPRDRANVAQMFIELHLISPVLGKWPSRLYKVIENGTNR